MKLSPAGALQSALLHLRRTYRAHLDRNLLCSPRLPHQYIPATGKHLNNRAGYRYILKYDLPQVYQRKHTVA
ncbi:hypothetical protein D3C87_862160 [compost metagenome]